MSMNEGRGKQEFRMINSTSFFIFLFFLDIPAKTSHLVCSTSYLVHTVSPWWNIAHMGRVHQWRLPGRSLHHPQLEGETLSCSHEGCIKNAHAGWVCRRHGTKRKQWSCSHEHEGCTKNSNINMGGVCWRGIVQILHIDGGMVQIPCPTPMPECGTVTPARRGIL